MPRRRPCWCKLDKGNEQYPNITAFSFFLLSYFLLLTSSCNIKRCYAKRPGQASVLVNELLCRYCCRVGPTTGCRTLSLDSRWCASGISSIHYLILTPSQLSVRHDLLAILRLSSSSTLQHRIDAMDVPFPTDVQEFDSDDRISFSKLDNKFIAVHDDGTEFEFDPELKRWTAIEQEAIDDDLDELREFSRTPADDAALDKKRKADWQNGDAVSFTCQTRNH